jgi:peptide/nickel transport system substrate-binding protein
MRTRRLSRLSAAVAVLVVGAAVLAGSTAAGASTHAAKPQKGGTLITMESSDNHTSWDPILLLGVPRYDSPGAFAIYDTLLWEDPATLKLQPRIATALTTADAGKTWTLKLHQGVRFTDGTTLDAAAVQYNWDRMRDPVNKAVAAANANLIDTMEVVDPLTLKITLKTVDPNWNRRVAYTLSTIASPTALKSMGSTAFGTKPVGAGPFILKEWVRNDHQTFVRNPDYWEKGKPYIDEIDHKFIADDSTRYNTFRTTPNSMNFQFDPSLAPQVKANGDTSVTQPPNGGGWALTFQTQKPPFNDLRARQAIALALDANAFNKTRRNSDPSLLMSTLDQKGTPFYDKGIAVPKVDLSAAQKLVDQIVSDNGGKPLSFTYSYFNTGYGQLDAEFLLAEISKLKNVDMKLEPLASTVLIGKFNTGDFQVYPSIPRWNEPAVDMVQTFLTGSAVNYARYSNPTVDAALKQLVVETDQKKRVDLVHTAQQQILKDLPVAFYTRYASYTLFSKSIKDVTLYYDQRFILSDIWISSKNK